MEDLETPKEWFKANIDTIVDTFGPQHQIQKEDIFLGKFRFSCLSVLSLLILPSFSYRNS